MISKLSLRFRIIHNGQLIREETLTQGVIKIGKVPSAHLRLDDESVSRMHAIVEVTGDDVSLIDLGSTRGTFVNGQKINKAKLHDGDAIMIGDTLLELAINAPALATTAAPTAPATTMPARTPAAPAAPAATMTARAPAAPAIPAPPMTWMAPPPVAARAATPAAPMFPAAAADDLGAAGAVEVAAMLGDSVVHVKHCMDPKSGKVTRATWAFLAGGLAALLTSGVAFAVSVNTAAVNKGAFDYWTRIEHKPAYAYRPHTDGPAVDFLAFGGLAVGLASMTLGLARARRERRSPYYRIGTAPGVETALETAPTASFPLVAPSGDDFVLNYGAGLDGEITVDGTTTPLSELAASGRARPSLTTAGAIEVPIPARARIRVRSGQTTFLVSAVARPREQAVPLFSLQNRTLAYFAGSLAVHLGLWAFLQTIPEDGTGVNVTLGVAEEVGIKATDTTNEIAPPEQPDDPTTGESGEKTGVSGKMALEEGAAGTTHSDRQDSHIRINDKHMDPAVARQEAIRMAQEAGILGSTSLLQSSVTALGSDSLYSSGFDTSDVNGALFGAEGEGQGVFGGGVHGLGIGGGCGTPPCGIIGTGPGYQIGNGPGGSGNGWGLPGNGHGGMRRHDATAPQTALGRPTSGDGLDKAIIKRYIKRNLNKIAYCYEHELLAHPGMQGEVTVQFFIGSTGAVQTAAGAGFDPTVASCVASVVKSIEFPKPTDGGGVQVNYPFNFHAAGSGQ